jgi:serine/threonine protein kinase
MASLLRKKTGGSPPPVGSSGTPAATSTKTSSKPSAGLTSSLHVSMSKLTVKVDIPITVNRKKVRDFLEKLTLQPEKYTLYSIQVSISTLKPYFVNRRYSEFYILHRLLLRKLPVLKQLNFPKKRLFFNLSKTTVEERRTVFIEYLNQLLLIKPRPFDFNRFLQLSEHMPRGKYNESSDQTRAVGGTSQVGLDDFELIRVLGRGAFGKVFLVRRVETTDVYAMKVLKKSEIKKRGQTEHTKTERRVMGGAEHPFLVHLRFAFQTSDNLFFVTDYCSGGELFFHLRRLKVFPEATVRFYSAEIYLGLAHLHEQKIVYRDLKPENVLLDAQGHVRIADFGLAKDRLVDGEHGATTFCGTPDYLSPELIQARQLGGGVGYSVDWWGLGVMMYEMFTSWSPFYDRNIKSMLQKILVAPLTWPKTDKIVVSDTAKDIIKGLLTRDATTRLGANGQHQEIRAHPFFADIDFEALLRKEVTSPLHADLQSPEQSAFVERDASKDRKEDLVDVSNFNKKYTTMPVIITPGPRASRYSEMSNFESFTFSDRTGGFTDVGGNDDLEAQEDLLIDAMVSMDEEEDEIIMKDREAWDIKDQKTRRETMQAIRDFQAADAATGGVYSTV